ncbi:MAG: hypothetical protein ACR2NN_29710 [Bryobacteraceae bacterium]
MNFLIRIAAAALISLLLPYVARPSTIISVGGAIAGYTAAAGISEGWATSTSLTGVTITAHLANGNSLPSAGTAYLTNQIGPGTTLGNLIAQSTVNLSCAFCVQDVLLFNLNSEVEQPVAF